MPETVNSKGPDRRYPRRPVPCKSAKENRWSVGIWTAPLEKGSLLKNPCFQKTKTGVPLQTENRETAVSRFCFDQREE